MEDNRQNLSHALAAMVAFIRSPNVYAEAVAHVSLSLNQKCTVTQKRIEK